MLRSSFTVSSVTGDYVEISTRSMLDQVNREFYSEEKVTLLNELLDDIPNESLWDIYTVVKERLIAKGEIRDRYF